MKRWLKAGFALTLIVAWSMTLAQATLEYTQKEKKPCTYCHVKMGAKELNDTGKCYEEKKSLKDCPVPDKT